MKKEKILIVIIAFITLTLINLPIFYFYVAKSDNLVFLGRRVINGEDTYTYVSFIEQSRQGRNLFENLYTTEEQKPLLLRPSYLFLGKLAAILKLSSITTYHLARIVFSIFFFIVIYKFICKFFNDTNTRLVAFFVICLSYGFGAINWIPEAFTFLSLAEAPHFILSQILMLLGFYFLIDFSLISPILFFLLSFEHPFNILVVSSTIIFSFLWSRKGLLKALIFVSLPLAGILYQLFEIRNNPILASWQAQNSTLSPSPNDYLLGFGILIPLAIIGIEIFIKKNKFKYKLILTWVIASIIMLYSPTNFQTRMIEGIHIPISILATSGIFVIYNRLKKHKNVFLFLILIILPIWSLTSIVKDFKIISANQSHYYSIDKDEFEAISWLGSNTNFDDIILSNKDYGNIIPGLIGRKTYLGHSIQTTNLKFKIANTNSFLLEQNEFTANSFVYFNKITYIFLGKDDFMLKYGFMPEKFHFLEKIYDKAGVLIYKVRQNDLFTNQK